MYNITWVDRNPVDRRGPGCAGPTWTVVRTFETVQIEQLHQRAGAVTRSDVSSGGHDNYVTVYEEREGKRLWWLLSASRSRVHPPLLPHPPFSRRLRCLASRIDDSRRACIHEFEWDRPIWTYRWERFRGDWSGGPGWFSSRRLGFGGLGEAQTFILPPKVLTYGGAEAVEEGLLGPGRETVSGTNASHDFVGKSFDFSFIGSKKMIASGWGDSLCCLPQIAYGQLLFLCRVRHRHPHFFPLIFQPNPWSIIGMSLHRRWISTE